MSTANHTPGPWRVDDRYLEGENDVLAADGFMVADVPYAQMRRAQNGRKKHRDISVEEQVANAKLIAAAPALAEALENFRRRHPKCVIAATGAETRCAACVAADNALGAAGRLP